MWRINNNTSISWDTALSVSSYAMGIRPIVCLSEGTGLDVVEDKVYAINANNVEDEEVLPELRAISGTEIIAEGDSYDVTEYFTITERGTDPYTVKYTVNNEIISNTNVLEIGNHVLMCTITGEEGSVKSVPKNIIVESAVPTVNSKGLASKTVRIKPDDNSKVQIVIPEGWAPAILEGSNTVSSLPTQSGKVIGILPVEQWTNITVEQINSGVVLVNNTITYTNGIPNFEEYVWVPIPERDKFERVAWTEADGTTEKKLSRYKATSSYAEEIDSTEYKEMLESVYANRGFCIGRYEASQKDSTIAQSKRGQMPWNNVKKDEAMSYISNSEINNVHLIYGVEWDSVLNWFIGNAKITTSARKMTLADVQTDSSAWGNYDGATGGAATGSASLRNTGYSEYWKANNIYDIAGNLIELTQEIFDWIRATVRGDSFYGPNAEYPGNTVLQSPFNVAASRWGESGAGINGYGNMRF